MGPTFRRRPIALMVAVALGLTTGCGSTALRRETVAQQPGAGGTSGSDLSVGQQPIATDGSIVGTLPTGDGAVPGAPLGAAVPGGAGGATPGRPTGAAGQAVTAPIKVGLFITDFAKAAAAIGGGEAQSGNNANPESVWKRLIAELNKRGGAGGRIIEPVSYIQDGTSNNYPAEYAAACEFFARDQKVAVVLQASIPDPTFAACLMKAGIASINASQGGLDRAQWSKVPGLLLPSGVSFDLFATVIVDQMVATGFLTNKDKVGVLLSECPNSQQVYKDVLEPRLRKYGVSVEPFTASECIQGFSGVSSVAAGLQSAAFRFNQVGVTKVMPLLASLENLGLGLFAQNAENQRYYPGYMVSTGGRAEELKQAGTLPANQFKNVRGVGVLPAYDLFTLGIEHNQQGKLCFDLAKAAGFAPAIPVEQAGLIILCDTLLFLDAVLDKTRGASDGTTFVAAAHSLTDYTSAGTIGGPGDFRDVDAVEFGQAFQAEPSCNCIRYTGSPVRLTAAG